MFQFERVVCITLTRRPDRWQRFTESLPGDWPFGPVEKFEAIDGKRCKAPDWWRTGSGAWGCFRSHQRIIEECLNRGVHSCLILEDDAVCCGGFSEQVQAFLNSLPAEAGMIYLGGQHLFADTHPPVPVNPNVYVPFNVNRTHAYAIRGQHMLRVVYEHLANMDKQADNHHVDHYLGRLHMQRQHPIYCPKQWLIGQDFGRSEVSNRQCQRLFFPAAQKYWNPAGDFYAVMGLPDPSVTKWLEKLIGSGQQAAPDNGECRDEANSQRGMTETTSNITLGQLCEQLMPFPQNQSPHCERSTRAAIGDWVFRLTKAASQQGDIALGFAPQLMAWGDILYQLFGNRLKIISIKRPLADSMANLQLMYPAVAPGLLKNRLQQLEQVRQSFLDRSGVPATTLQHSQIVESPEAAQTQIVRFAKSFQ